ncbi:MAG: 1,6-anhydro-N-acetylmuramyl-L-alanine amidase AmpD [Oceanospirillaceae bacterium]|nr:1,6-anhydro-N-acetylmuramyl-L-alanine amidase AmpD [Oceanospirillaceae bacterium]
MQKFSIVDGQLLQARQVPSPNCNQRATGEVLELLVIHNISLPPREYGGGYIEQFFQNSLDVDQHPYFASIKDLHVSAHLLITRIGEVVQFVNFKDRAWHAGVSNYKDRRDCNDFSIGIELEGCDDEAFTQQQYQVLAQVSTALQSAYPLINVENTHGHSDIAPGRKTDPGDSFDWKKYRDLWVGKVNSSSS